MKKIPLIIFGFLCQISLLVQADSVSGSADPMFKSVVSIWLEDNDVDSLLPLAEMAKQGNIAARLLLARIEVTDRAPSAYVRNLSRKDYNKLFRSNAESLKLKPSWLVTESKLGNQLARTLLDATALGINLDTVRQLFQLGEQQAAEYQIRKVAVDGTREQQLHVLEMMGENFESAPYVRGFLHSREKVTTGIAALEHILGDVNKNKSNPIQIEENKKTEDALLYIRIGYQAGKELINFDSKHPLFSVLSKWIMNSDQTIPIATICQQACSEEEIPKCANTAFGLMGGYYEVIRMDSPVESIIPQNVYIQSQRARNSAIRKIAGFRSEAGQLVFNEQELRVQSSCLANVVTKI